MKCNICNKKEATYTVQIFNLKELGNPEKEILCCSQCVENINFREYMEAGA